MLSDLDGGSGLDIIVRADKKGGGLPVASCTEARVFVPSEVVRPSTGGPLRIGKGNTAGVSSTGDC